MIGKGNTPRIVNGVLEAKKFGSRWCQAPWTGYPGTGRRWCLSSSQCISQAVFLKYTHGNEILIRIPTSHRPTRRDCALAPDFVFTNLTQLGKTIRDPRTVPGIDAPNCLYGKEDRFSLVLSGPKAIKAELQADLKDANQCSFGLIKAPFKSVRSGNSHSCSLFWGN